MVKLIDLSQTIETDMPIYPGDMKTNLYQNKYLGADKHTNHRLEIGMHTGTHIDSPMHLIECDQFISELPLTSFIANGCLLDVRNQSVITMRAEYETLITENSIVLLYTGFDALYGKDAYYESHPVVDRTLCEFLLKKNIKMLGMDMPSPDLYPFDIHIELLKNNVTIIENLVNLDQLMDVEAFEVMAFPLKIKADSSIARVVARILD